jgi:hypothetical protein
MVRINWEDNCVRICYFIKPCHVYSCISYLLIYGLFCRPQWPRGVRSGSAAACVFGFRIRIPLGTWMSVCYECWWLLGRDPCVGVNISRKESCPVWYIWLWSQSLDNEEALAHQGLSSHGRGVIFILRRSQVPQSKKNRMKERLAVVELGAIKTPS